MRLAAAVAVVGFATLWLLTPHLGLSAGETVGELAIVQVAAGSPRLVSVRYQPSAAIAGVDSVILAADEFASGDLRPTRRSYTLRQTRGAFVARFTLGPGTALATFEIHTADEKRQDDNAGRRWEYVVRDSAERPSFAGLRLQSQMHALDDWERSFDATKEMVRYYPDEPAAVRTYAVGLLELAGASRADSQIAALRPMLRRLDSLYAKRSASPDLLWQMTMLANLLRDSTTSRRWLERLTSEYPASSAAVQLNTFAILSRNGTDKDRLAALDSLWTSTGGRAIQLPAEGFRLAEKMNDVDLIARWGDRFAGLAGYETFAAPTFIRFDRLRGRGEAMLRESLKAANPVTGLAWQEALSEGRSPRTRQGQWQLTMLGEALLRDGQSVSAEDTLRRAAGLGWDATTLRTLASAALANADSAEAAAAYAWLIGNDLMANALPDSLASRLGSWRDRPEVASALQKAHSVRRRSIIAETFHRALPQDPSYTSSAGDRVAVSRLTDRPLAVIAMVSRNCAPSLADLPHLEQARSALQSLGISVVALVEETPGADALRDIAAHGYRGAVGFDDRAEVARSLRQVGTPQYFILENGHTIRAATRRADELVPLITALR